MAEYLIIKITAFKWDIYYVDTVTLTVVKEDAINPYTSSRPAKEKLLLLRQFKNLNGHMKKIKKKTVIDFLFMYFQAK
jgi:hypothetical protein